MGGETSTPYKRLGAWLGRADNTVYQAATDGFVVGMYTGQAVIFGYTDGANPPTIVRQQNGGGGVNIEKDLCFPVKKNDYWKTNGCTVFVYWIPLEP